MQIIELDCPPGSLRPDDLIAGVIAGTGLPVRTPVAKTFGNWRWDYSDISAPQWQNAFTILEDRIIKLYHNGTIRYGAWN